MFGSFECNRKTPALELGTMTERQILFFRELPLPFARKEGLKGRGSL